MREWLEVNSDTWDVGTLNLPNSIQTNLSNVSVGRRNFCAVGWTRICLFFSHLRFPLPLVCAVHSVVHSTPLVFPVSSNWISQFGFSCPSARVIDLNDVNPRRQSFWCILAFGLYVYFCRQFRDFWNVLRNCRFCDRFRLLYGQISYLVVKFLRLVY